jgi:hypothetical protein
MQEQICTKDEMRKYMNLRETVIMVKGPEAEARMRRKTHVSNFFQ